MFSGIFSLFFASLLAVSSWLFFSQPSLGALPFVSGLFAGSSPTNLGVHNEQLAACPATPNCVVSQSEGVDQSHHIKPIVYQGDRSLALSTLVKILEVVPRTQVIEETKDYLRAESTSRLLGFVDDLEFYFPEDKSVIEVRSSSRLGESDLGVNRRRMEQIRLAFQDLNKTR